MTKFFLFISLFFSNVVFASQYQSPSDFVSEAFSGKPPAAQSFWITPDLKEKVADILQHKAGFMRTRYWRVGNKSVWVLNEIGKTQLITVGIIIENNAIQNLKVLEFKESRGWEVKHSFFTDQFKSISINSDHSLSKPIDGISGATLSVRALKKTAMLALFFNQQINK
jgi:hypothetical protein